MRPIWARRRDPAAFHLGTPEIGTARDSGFAADSSLEEERFEPPVSLGRGSAGNVERGPRPEGFKVFFSLDVKRFTLSGPPTLLSTNA
jgi:hypothetical protein